VNGQVVSDEEAQRLLRRGATLNRTAPIPRARRLFPSTENKFGSLSQSLYFLGFEVEIIWLVFLGVALYCFGVKGFLVLGFLAALYENNSQSRR